MVLVSGHLQRWACTVGGLWQTIFRTPSLLLPHPHLQLFGNQGVGKRSVEVVAKFSCYFHTSIFSRCNMLIIKWLQRRIFGGVEVVRPEEDERAYKWAARAKKGKPFVGRHRRLAEQGSPATGRALRWALCNGPPRVRRLLFGAPKPMNQFVFVHIPCFW